MTKEKQIEEMAKVIGDADQRCFDMDSDDCPFHTMELGLCKEKFLATALYNAGYRKQSEGEWIDKPTGAYGRMQSWCSACGNHSGIGGIESNRHKPYCPNCGAKMKGGAE
jgi:hypothetical protein